MQITPAGVKCITERENCTQEAFLFHSLAIMGLRRVPIPFRLTWVIVLVLCVSAPEIKSQIEGCSLQGLDLGPCLCQRNSSISINDMCCKMLNDIVRIGFNCLCLLLQSSFPLLNAPLSLPLPNCYISVPSLSSCQGVLVPMPVGYLPPSHTRDELIQPPMPPKDVPLPPPPHDVQVPTYPTVGNNSAIGELQPPSTENTSHRSSLSKEREISDGTTGSKIMLRQALFQSLAPFLFVLYSFSCL